jgi:hypothetical protein
LPENHKARRNAIKQVKRLISQSSKREAPYRFRIWIPKDSQLKYPIRIYVDQSDTYITQHQNKLIIVDADTNRQLKLVHFLLKHDIDIKNLHKLGELSDLLSEKGLLIPEQKSSIRNKPHTAKTAKEKPLTQSRLKKGDSIKVEYEGQELLITITHIETDHKIPSVNVSLSGQHSFNLTSAIKGKTTSKRSRKLTGSNKGKGWAKGRQAVKK